MRYLLLLLLLLIASPAMSQTGFEGDARERWKSGSVYSYFGIGVPNTFFSSQAGGMGLQGVALYNTYLNNASNPALWGYPLFTTGLGSFYATAYNATDANASADYTAAGIGSLQLMLPLERNRLGLNISLQPYSTVGYRVATSAVIPAGVIMPDNAVGYSTEQNGSGGLNKLEVGFGYSLTENISVGFAPALAFGIIDRLSVVSFDTLLFQDVEFRNREILTGFSGRAGLFANRSNILSANDNFSFGLTYEMPVKLDARERLYTRYLADEVELPVRSDATTTIPWKVSTGLAYRPSRFVLMSAEVAYQPWGEFKDVGTVENVDFSDQLTMGIGTEFSLNNRRNSGFFRNIIYRAGLSHDSGYLKFESQNISTTQIHAGFGIPSRFTSSSIDVNFSYGVRGPGTTDFVKERIFLTRVSFNLSEAMFLRRKIQ